MKGHHAYFNPADNRRHTKRFAFAPETTLAHLAERFLRFKAEYAVVEDNGVPVGVVPVKCCTACMGDGVAPQTPVKEFMNSSVANVSTSWHWSEACRCLAEQAASCLIVSDPAADTLAVLTKGCLSAIGFKGFGSNPASGRLYVPMSLLFPKMHR